jgi:hypothetical protein
MPAEVEVEKALKKEDADRGVIDDLLSRNGAVFEKKTKNLFRRLSAWLFWRC